MKKHKRLTAEEKEKIVDLYINTDISMNQLSKIYDVDQTTISCTLKKYNIEIVHKVGGRKRKYTVDDNYFDVIDDEHKAYWLGWLYSDGNNYIEKGVISLTVQSGDLEILEKLKCDLSSNPKKETPEFIR